MVTKSHLTPRAQWRVSEVYRGMPEPVEFVVDGFGVPSPVCPKHGVVDEMLWYDHRFCRRE